jgi:DNA-binding NtrC family response regulator
MSEPVRVLIVEDDPVDAGLMVRELKRAGFAPDWVRVETESDYLAQLETRPDIVLSDSNLPLFDGFDALDLLRRSGLNIPFVLVSGRVGEDLAVEAMKRGAWDYLLKDRLTRLGESVRRTLPAGLRNELGLRLLTRRGCKRHAGVRVDHRSVYAHHRIHSR